MNKNDQFQLEKERRDQLNKFARALAAGQTGLLNRVSQTIEAGDLVFYDPVEQTAYTVVDVAPCMDVRLPPGLLNVTLVAMPFTVQVPAGQPWRQALPTTLRGNKVPPELVKQLNEISQSVGRRIDLIKQTAPDEHGEGVVGPADAPEPAGESGGGEPGGGDEPPPGEGTLQ